MTALSIQPTFPIFTDSDGTALENGFIWIGVAGSEPISTPLTAYWDAALTQVVTQPVRTRGGYPLNGSDIGRLYVNSNYSIKVRNRNGFDLYSSLTATERYSEVVVNTNASQVVYNPAGTGAVATTVQTKLRESVSVLDFGADPTGATNSQAGFNAAFAFAVESGKPVYIPAGTYLLDEIPLTNGKLVGNGNKYGQQFYGDGPGKTILKCSGASAKFLQFLGSPGFYFYTYFKAEDFSIDMALMPNAATSMGVYGIFAYGGTVTNVNVINRPASAFSLYLDQGCYTTVWTNCDFGGVDGVVKLQGIGGQSVTTQTFVGCSWGQFIADNCSSNNAISCIIQGDITPKFVLSEQYGMSVIGCDIEGTGTVYAFGTNCNQFVSMNNALVGFSGTYSTGGISSGMLMDQVYPVTAGGQPFVVKNQAVTSSAVASGFAVAQEINGTVTEKVIHNGITRKLIENSNTEWNTVDQQFKSANGSTFVGRAINGDSYIEGSPSKEIGLKVGGEFRIGVTAINQLRLGTITRAAVGASGGATALPANPAGYMDVVIGGSTYLFPFYNAP